MYNLCNIELRKLSSILQSNVQIKPRIKLQLHAKRNHPKHFHPNVNGNTTLSSTPNIHCQHKKSTTSTTSSSASFRKSPSANLKSVLPHSDASVLFPSRVDAAAIGSLYTLGWRTIPMNIYSLNSAQPACRTQGVKAHAI